MRNRYVYLKQPGILYDMMFALKLRFNGERAYAAGIDGSNVYDDDRVFFQNIIEELSGISDKLLPFFYRSETAATSTGLIAFMQENWEEYRYASDDLIDDFYHSLRNVQKLKKSLYQNYVSSECPDVIDATTFHLIRDTLYEADLPHDVKLYLTDFLLCGENEIDFLISELKKVQAFCEEMYKINIDTVNGLVSDFNTEKVTRLSRIRAWDILRYKNIYFTYCLICRHSLYGTYYNDDDWISYLGIKSDEKIDEYTPEFEIDLYELGRILYDEVRLKILAMLQKKAMYCAEIARELGLKNNSTLYHLSMMERQKLLITLPERKKIYYTINSRYLDNLKKFIDNIEIGTKNQ